VWRTVLQWSRLSESVESTAARQTSNVDLGACCDADAAQLAMDAECRPAVRDDQRLHAHDGGSVKPAPLPVSAVRLSNRCVLLTYFDGDVASSVDEHFARSLKSAATRYVVQADDGHAAALQQQLCRRTSSKYRANSKI